MRRLSFVLLRTMLLPAALAGQSPLPLGTPAMETVSSAEPVRFEFRATASGVLTVILTGKDDLSMSFVDVDGQVLPYGFADGDLGGNVGTEILSVPIKEVGVYVVEVRTYSEQSVPFKINAHFMAEPAFASPPDTDGRPGLGTALQVGSIVRDSLNPEGGDNTDWYTFTATEAATLVFSTRVADNTTGDITLEAYLDGEYAQWIAIADQDIRGNPANESLVIDVAPGEVIRIKLASLGNVGGRLDYRLTVAKLP